MIKDYLTLGIRNLRKRKLRSWLTILGILISIATIFVLISVSLGLQDAVQEQFRQLGTDKFFIMPKSVSISGPTSDSSQNFTVDDARIVEKISGIKSVSYVALANAKVEFGDQRRYFPVLGMSEENIPMLMESMSIKIDEGNQISKGAVKQIALGSQFKYNNIFKKPVEAGDTIIINGEKYKVRAIFQPIGNPSDDKNIYMLHSDFKELFKTGDNILEIIAQVDDPLELNTIVNKTDKKLMSYRGVKEDTKDYSILTPEELMKTIGVILNIITAFLGGVAAISLLVGAIGIANTMYTSVLERTKEIGTMKAVGARNSDILLIFLIESGLLGLVGGIAGVILGFGFAKILEYVAVHAFATTLLQTATPPYLFVGCLTFAFLAGAISGIWPAWRAAHIKTVDALRYE